LDPTLAIPGASICWKEHCDIGQMVTQLFLQQLMHPGMPKWIQSPSRKDETPVVTKYGRQSDKNQRRDIKTSERNVKEKG